MAAGDGPQPRLLHRPRERETVGGELLGKQDFSIDHADKFIYIDTDGISYIAVHFNRRGRFFPALCSILFKHRYIGFAYA